MKKQTGEVELSVYHLAQIKEGTVSFGDLTFFVGAQASGKSLFLQMLKLMIDRHQIFDNLALNAYDWGGKFDRLLDMYFGESMSGIWKPETSVTFGGKVYDSKSIMARQGSKGASKEEKVFYIPAQRVVTMSQGFPRPFSSFEVGDPYVLKSFSETMRVLMEKESSNGNQDNIYPKTGKMSKPIRAQLDASIFHGVSIEMDRSSGRKRFILNVGESRLPFMTWSAGQKEFMPLLLSLYHLIPSGNSQKKRQLTGLLLKSQKWDCTLRLFKRSCYWHYS